MAVGIGGISGQGASRERESQAASPKETKARQPRAVDDARDAPERLGMTAAVIHDRQES